MEWVKDVREEHPSFFKEVSVLELGARSINGTIRGYFENCYYLGVDKYKGTCVDIVSDAKETNFKGMKFQTLISLSMLEHDPDWRESISHNLRWVIRNGLIILSWGAEGNEPHMEDELPFAEVSHQDMLDLLTDHNCEILDNFWEEERYGKNCPGAYNILARKK